MIHLLLSYIYELNLLIKPYVHMITGMRGWSVPEEVAVLHPEPTLAQDLIKTALLFGHATRGLQPWAESFKIFSKNISHWLSYTQYHSSSFSYYIQTKK